MSRRRVLTSALIALSLLSIAACSRPIEPPAGPLVSAVDTQFEPPISLVLKTGSSSGLELPGTRGAHYWFTDATASFDLTNRESSAQTLRLTGLLMPVSCGSKSVQVEMLVGAAKAVTLRAAGKNTSVDFGVTVQPSSTTNITFITVSPPCQVQGDPRTFYSGIALFKASKPTNSFELGHGVTASEVPLNQSTLNWIVAPTASLVVTHNTGKAGSGLVITGSLIPPPCAATNVQLRFVDQGRTVRTVTLPRGGATQKFSVPLSVPVGQKRSVTLIPSTTGCTIATDSRTFFAGIRDLGLHSG